MKIDKESLLKNAQPYLNDETLMEMIAKCAYFKAEKRNFTTGYEAQDWIDAEQEIANQGLVRSNPITKQ